MQVFILARVGTSEKMGLQRYFATCRSRASTRFSPHQALDDGGTSLARARCNARVFYGLHALTLIVKRPVASLAIEAFPRPAHKSRAACYRPGVLHLPLSSASPGIRSGSAVVVDRDDPAHRRRLSPRARLLSVGNDHVRAAPLRLPDARSLATSSRCRRALGCAATSAGDFMAVRARLKRRPNSHDDTSAGEREYFLEEGKMIAPFFIR